MKINAFQEKFSGSELDATKWSVAGDVVEADDHLRLPADTDGALIQTVKRYDLTNSQIYARIDVQSTNAAAKVNFTLTNTVGDKAEFMLQQSKLIARLKRSAVTSDLALPYDPETQLWWRIREQSGTLYWDISTTGRKWSNVRNIVHHMDLTSVQLSIGGLVIIGTGYGFGPFASRPFGV